ncbi:alpha/beta-hydrolase [Lindgomyces ingoldianus]|uniref:Alpha/beta-hydrolase n=1 Tax=Lindgomyces ingoldianus TaxID=673940 RepID=A0ACB6QVJ6_9PLEO|nr:alpha/beta-hydrolase [Lindgomyces ingoldianus]KAF2470530.1 alpha/beta-hydrolase [Lindgomyces ingoldianus]
MRCNTWLLALVATLVPPGASTPLSAPNVTATASVLLPAGTVIGTVGDDGVEYFRGIPFAQPPTGSLRLKPPVRLQSFDSGSVEATGVGPACPQMTAIDATPLLLDVLALPDVQGTLFFGSTLGDEREDCLTISVMRPKGTRAAIDAKLPVLFYIFGGGFETGSPQMYNGSVLIPESVAQGKPMIFVAVNYRLGAFGFLGGNQVLEDGAANLGLLDQRMGLEWVADNIAAFGGDPDAVTIWGQSAGAMSVFDQLALFDGDNTYKNRSLFRGAIMNSGSITPTEPVNGVKAQEIFDKVVETAGCASAADSAKLECLRGLDYDTFVTAANSVPAYLGYNSLAFSYAPRPDGRILTASPEDLAQKGKYAAVPMIIGNQENEGTIFALFQSNITTEAALVSYLNDVFFHNANRDEIEGLIATYPNNPDSPDGIGASNDTYPEFKRLAAVLGDWEFTFMARLLLQTFPATVPAWSYLATYESGTPILGTYHATDLPHIYYETSNVSRSIQDLYISFVDSLDPNNYAPSTPSGYLSPWPTWQEKKQLLELGAQSTYLIDDNARAASFEYIRTHLETLRL